MIVGEYLASAPILMTAIGALVLLNVIISIVLGWRRRAVSWRPDRAEGEFQARPPHRLPPPD